ncbi:histidinolphosphatase-like protein [Ophiocordyceps camponoti-floridani]|uniref:Histidinolphosphatase-like protein n=1 Tax=Ophiocordyceps camponoti-floridani TaxID=2030778 RepID=A0A8H4VC71_9HYPO|nr:histidinolphosphatase-like protein [Ophiocordyceps camponoti-floridani]
MTSPIQLNLPQKYSASSPARIEPPPVSWLASSPWAVTHSTLAMWRDARNVRIRYTALANSREGRPRLDDLVEYEPLKSDGVRKEVAGVDTQDVDGAWDWRGKRWLFFVSSHWEVLGWGEELLPDGKVERWAITWFAPTAFTKEGVDIYCDSREGISEATYNRLMEALAKLEAPSLVTMIEGHMRPVEIRLPWVEA